MPERESFMKLRSSKAAICTGAAVVMFLMPVVPEVAVAKTTYEQPESTVQFDTELRQASYTVNVSDIVATGYVEEKETGMYAGMAIAIADPYTQVYAMADENSEVVGQMGQNSIASAEEIVGEWTKIVSGNLTGFVKTSELCFNEEAQALGSSLGDVSATVVADSAALYLTADKSQAADFAANGTQFKAVGKKGSMIAVEYGESKAYVYADQVSIEYAARTGYTNEEIENIKAEEEEQRRQAEEAEREAARKAEEERAARIEAAMTDVGVSYNPTMEASAEEVWLLACVIDWESGWEPYEGKLAVANVVLNRVRNSRYDNTITGVIYARSQFSGVSDGYGNASSTFQARLDAGPRTQECLEAAMEALSGVNNIGSYTSFRSVSIANYDAYSSFTIIGGHVFY